MVPVCRTFLEPRIVAESVEVLSLQDLKLNDPRPCPFGFPNFQIGKRGRTGDGVGREGARVKEGATPVVRIVRHENLVTAQCHGERQRAARQALRIADNIWRDARLLTCEHRAGSPPSRHHLIRDEEYIVARTDLS